MPETKLQYANFAGKRLAYRFRNGRSPTILFLPGYASDMEGTKALAIDAFAGAKGAAMLRFDYSGTGSSDGAFEDGTLGGWLDEALHMLDHFTEGPVILAGSSMGGWLSLLIAKHRPDRVAALVGIAAAPDFTDWGYSDSEKQALNENGRLERPNPYAPEPQVTTFAFWQSGEAVRILGEPIAVDCPVRLIHGDADNEVPLDVALRTLENLRSADVQLTVIKGSGHRLSQDHEIETILRTLNAVLETCR
jgi:pimeloyl-ACP methyl ester carboxylesterase